MHQIQGIPSKVSTYICTTCSYFRIVEIQGSWQRPAATWIAHSLAIINAIKVKFIIKLYVANSKQLLIDNRKYLHI